MVKYTKRKKIFTSIRPKIEVVSLAGSKSRKNSPGAEVLIGRLIESRWCKQVADANKFVMRRVPGHGTTWSPDLLITQKYRKKKSARDSKREMSNIGKLNFGKSLKFFLFFKYVVGAKALHGV